MLAGRSNRVKSFASGLFLFVLLQAPAALAFPWMVKHNYGSCATCHVDPSGGGQTTSYGRAQADVLVRWKPVKPPPGQEEEVPRSAAFLWFLELPEPVNLSGNVRWGAVYSPGGPVTPLLMAADLYATFNVDRFVFHGTGGFGLHNLSAKAIVAPQCDPISLSGSGGQCGPSFVAREYWAGVKLADDAVMIRAGRLNLPFGLRNAEHLSWVRAYTLTDINTGQQLGASVSYNSDALRGELMAIAGNYQLGPDAFRERGYSAFAEYFFRPNASLGASSLVAYAASDLATGLATIRHAHGLFSRWAPVESLALMAEADFLAWVAPPQLDRIGFAALLQADWEPVQGIHVIATGESAYAGGAQPGPSLGGWLSVAWNFAPHCELRVDNQLRSQSTGKPVTYALLAQIHLFL
jgi:hypothetical protein